MVDCARGQITLSRSALEQKLKHPPNFELLARNMPIIIIIVNPALTLNNWCVHLMCQFRTVYLCAALETKNFENSEPGMVVRSFEPQ